MAVSGKKINELEAVVSLTDNSVLPIVIVDNNTPEPTAKKITVKQLVGDTLPDQTGQAGKVLTTDGNTASWQDPTGGVTSVNGETGTVVLTGTDINVSNNDTTKIDYYYYYVDIIVSADLFLMPGTLDGEAVSQRGSTTIGQVSYIIINKDDVPAVLSNDSSNKNKYYALHKNGTVSTSGTKVKADQLGRFDSSTVGVYATTLTVGSGTSAKVNPVIVNVIDVINAD